MGLHLFYKKFWYGGLTLAEKLVNHLEKLYTWDKNCTKKLEIVEIKNK